MPEITQLERSNRKEALKKKLFGEEMSSGGNNPGGNVNGNKNASTGSKKPTPTKPGCPGRRKKLPLDFQQPLKEKLAKAAADWRKEAETYLENQGKELEYETDDEDLFTGNGGNEDKCFVHGGSDKEQSEKERSDREDKTRRSGRGSSGRRPRRDDWDEEDVESEHPDGDGYDQWEDPVDNWRNYDPNRPVIDYMRPQVANIRPAIVVKLPKGVDRKSTRLNSSHSGESRMPSSA